MPDPIARSPRLDPQVRAQLEKDDAAGSPPPETWDPVKIRIARIDRARQLGGEPSPLARVEDISIPSPAGPIPARIYSLEHSGVHSAMIFFHGGGFVFGDLDTHDTICRALAHESSAVVIAIDYHLAPEHKFPAAVEDAHAATLWICENRETLGIDPRRI